LGEPGKHNLAHMKESLSVGASRKGLVRLRMRRDQKSGLEEMELCGSAAPFPRRSKFAKSLVKSTCGAKYANEKGENTPY